MKQPKTFLLLSVIVAVLILGVAYAAISNITLTVNGTATASPDQANFDVKFTNPSTVTPGTSGNGSGTLVIDTKDPLVATLTVSGFKKVGDKTTATIDVTNVSTDLGATLISQASAVAETLTIVAEDDSTSTKASTDSYFKVEAKLDTQTIAKNGGKAVLTITVELIKVPIEGDVVGTFNVTVVASPTNA